MFCLINNELLIKMKEFYNCCMYNYYNFLNKNISFELSFY